MSGQRSQEFLKLSSEADSSFSKWNEVRSSLVAEVLRRPVDSAQPVPRRLYGEVRGESMLPTLWPGDVVAIEPCTAQALRTGEIVLVSWKSYLVLHRLMTPYSEQGFSLRGDCVATFDAPYPGDALLGKVVGIMRGTRTVSKLSMRPGIGARVAQTIGQILCRWGFARRVTLRLRNRLQSFRRKTDPAEFATDFVVRGMR
jgi:signal peptidase I